MLKQSCHISTMFAHMYASMIIDGIDQAKTMMPRVYYVCKYVCIYNRWDGPGKDNAATFLLCLLICIQL